MEIKFNSKESELYNLYNTIINSKTYKTLNEEYNITIKPQISFINEQEVIINIDYNDIDTLTNIIKDIDEPLEDIINTLQGNIRQDNIDLIKDLVDALIEVLIKDSNRRYVMTNIIYIAYMLKKYIHE